MPRPETKGLKYFPFDVGFFGDKKIRLLRGEHGAEGVEIYQRLICNCYAENGYFLKWDNETDYALMADDTGYSIDKIRLIVSSCLKWSLFDGTLFKSGNVLTSRSIQRRYFIAISATKAAAAKKGRHVSIEKDMCLLTDEDISEINKNIPWLDVTLNDGKSTINPCKSSINDSKSAINPLNKTKLNKTKEKNTTTTAPGPESPPFEVKGVVVVNDALMRCYQENIEAVPGPLNIEKIHSWLDTFPAEVIMRAIGEAAREGHRKCSYVEGILRNWEKDRLFSLSLVEGHLKAWESKKAGDSSRRQYKTAYERTMDTARSEIEKFKKGEVTLYDV